MYRYRGSSDCHTRHRLQEQAVRGGRPVAGVAETLERLVHQDKRPKSLPDNQNPSATSNDGALEADEAPRLQDLNIREKYALQPGDAGPGVSTSTSHVNSKKRPAAESGSTDQHRGSPRSPKAIHTLQPSRFKPDPDDGGVYSNTMKYTGYDFDTAPATATRFPDSLGHARSVQLVKPPTLLSEPKMILQPETRPISEEQLINEVRGIYAGLVMVEKKCVEIDQQQSQTSNKLSDEQWQALIALHRTLLHEHHDFFLASQHPSASPALQRLASKYAMPARMWRHGIHSFLELLRHRLPESLDHMLAFIYTAYSMMALLMESVPTFEDTWIECLGDLARYRMAVEEADLRDREVWAGVARYWYNKAADKSPNVGRIQHHLAVLARPNILQQLFFYTKSLICKQPFLNTRESIMLLFNPILDPTESAHRESGRPHHLPVMTAFVSAHGTMFTSGFISTFIKFGDEFITYLENQIGRVGSKWREQGVQIASANFASMLEYGNPDGIMMRILSKSIPIGDSPTSRVHQAREYWTDLAINYQKKELPDLSIQALSETTKFSSSLDILSYATYFSFYILSLILKHIGDKNVLPHVHVSLAFLWSLALIPQAMLYVQAEVPWEKLVLFLNTLNRQGVNESRLESDSFPLPDSGTANQLPEDFAMRGQIWNFYHPVDFFNDPSVDDEERSLELPSIAVPRTERCLWLAHRLASLNCWIVYDKARGKFALTQFAIELENKSKNFCLFDRRSRTVSPDMHADSNMFDAEPPIKTPCLPTLP